MSQLAPPTLKEIRKAARTTISILRENGIDSCLFGSAACSLYGLERLPNDVDLVVLNTNYSAEDIKLMLKRANRFFFLVKSRNPAATYKILYFGLPTPQGSPGRRRCKVDILIPNLPDALNIPLAPLSRLSRPNGGDLPCMPFLATLLLKLQGWTDHLDSEQTHHRAKIETDVDDIRVLLEMAGPDNYNVQLTDQNQRWMPRWFVRQSQERVHRFTEEYYDTSSNWETIGFNT